MRELWNARNLPGRIIDITPSGISDEYLLTADPDTMHLCKGLEIAAWLSEYGTPDTRYVIIDDECVALESQSNNLILTNPIKGITKELADRTITILNE